MKAYEARVRGMGTTPKITPDDYPDLLAARDAGISQRELARRYDCAPSLVARHMRRATLARGLSDTEGEPEADPNIRPVGRTTREVVQALIRDPKTSARDVASLTNALTRMNRDGEPEAPDLPVFPFRRGTIIIEPGPGPGSELRFRFMQRTREGIAHSSGGDYDLTATQAA
jgi:transposase-like protein